MKKIILKAFNLNGSDAYAGKLKNLSFYCFEGECTSVIGLNNSEKQALADILCGMKDQDWAESALYIQGKRVYDKRRLQNLVYPLKNNNYGLGNWTVAEYLGLNQTRGILTPGAVRKLNAQAETLLEDLDVEMNVNQRMDSLGGLERKMVEVIKGIRFGAAVLLISEDDFFGKLTEEELRLFVDFLKRMLKKGLTAIMLGGSDTTLPDIGGFAEQTIVIEGGTVLKKIHTDNLIIMPSVQKILMGVREEQTRKRRKKLFSPEDGESDYFTAYSSRLRMHFPQGKLSVILCSDNMRKAQLYAGLSGREFTEAEVPRENEIFCKLQGKLLKKGYHTYLEQRIVSIDFLGTVQDVFENFTVADNILLPSMRKFNGLQYVRYYKALKQVVFREKRLNRLMRRQKTIDLNINERISLVMERWLMYRPKVLILHEPFLNCDVKGSRMILDYINLFLNQGAAVIVIKAKPEYVEEIADQILNF